jgi:hypothetical protein
MYLLPNLPAQIVSCWERNSRRKFERFEEATFPFFLQTAAMPHWVE